MEGNGGNSNYLLKQVRAIGGNNNARWNVITVTVSLSSSSKFRVSLAPLTLAHWQCSSALDLDWILHHEGQSRQ